VDMNMNMKETLNAYLLSLGKEPNLVWDQMEQTIANVYIEREEIMGRLTAAFGSHRHFFEMVRFDFVLDEELNAYLMEANMSPNLSSLHFAPNQLLYEQVIFNMLSLVGITHTLGTHLWPHRDNQVWNMMVSDKDLSVFENICSSDECHLSCKSEKCKVCYYCLNALMKTTLKEAHLEHLSKWNSKRLVPSLRPTALKAKGRINELQAIWFQGKCLKNIGWC